MEKTKLLYRQDVYMNTCESEVLEVISEDNGLCVVLDQTVFFPEGGGQSSDIGTIGNGRVTSVEERDGIVYHHITSGSESGENEQSGTHNGKSIPGITAGATVICELNWEHRFDNMQRHCGEHILSGIFYGLYGAVNRGFHMGEEYMTIDMSLEDKPEFTELTWEMAMKAELQANKVIWSNAPVITRHFDKKEEAAKLPLRKALAVENDITIVCVGSVDNPADCVACCGTHPATAGQVGLIKIFKLESYKGMTRIYCEAGQRALEDYRTKHELITKIGNRYSAGTADLLDKMNTQEEKVKAVKNELYVLKQSVIEARVSDLRSQLENGGKDVIITAEYPDMKVDDLLHIGRPLGDNIKKLLLLISPQDNTLLLFSNGKAVDCGKLVKENASIYNGKGGGNASNARALFPNREYLDTFIDLIEKHLR